MKVLIKNGYIVSMISDIEKKDLLIEEDKISRICKHGEIEEKSVDKVIDASNCVVMPGLINAHTHIGMSLFRGYSDELELMDWLSTKIWPIEEKMTKEDIYYASMLSCIEMIKSGTTTFADHYFFEEETAKCVEEIGMRSLLARVIIFDNEEADKRINEAEELYLKWNNKADGRIKVCVGLHSPYTCPPNTIIKSVELAKKYDMLMHIHYLETLDEVNEMRKVYNKTSTQYLKDLGVFELHTMLAHGVHVTDEEMDILKNINGGIIHNPISNLKLGSGIAKIKEFRDRNINVALGTDGQGSTNTLDMFEEIKVAAYMQKVRHMSATAISGFDVLKMATIEGARVMNMENEIGSLEEGKKADVIIIDMNKPHLCPIHDIYSHLAYSVNGADVETVIVNGNIIMENRVIMSIGEKEIINKCSEISNRIF